MSRAHQYAAPPLAFGAARFHPSEAPRPRLPPMIAVSIGVLILGSLFSGLRGPAALGELQGEGALIGVLAIVLIATLSGVILDTRGLRPALIFLPLVVCILLSYAVNADDIGRAHFLGRAGGEKFVSALLVLGFYAGAFYAIFCVASVYGVEAVLDCAGSAALAAGVILGLEEVVEVASWFSPPLSEALSAARGVWSRHALAPPFRLVGFAPEPSFAAIASLGLLALLGCRALLDASRANRRWRLVLGIAVFLLVLQTLADARTFLVGALGGGLTWFLFGPAGRRIPPLLRSAIVVFAPLAAQAAITWEVASSAPGSRTVSNVTRAVGMLTASELWSAHPLLGVGLGQYAFHFRSVVPSWGLQSWEISRYFRYDQYVLMGDLPPSFSLFTRIGAELGLLGFLAWSLPPLYALRRAAVRAPGPLTTLMACALVAQIWTGLSLDSFRNIYYWFWLACLMAWPQQQPDEYAAVRRAL